MILKICSITYGVSWSFSKILSWLFRSCSTYVKNHCNPSYTYKCPFIDSLKLFTSASKMINIYHCYYYQMLLTCDWKVNLSSPVNPSIFTSLAGQIVTSPVIKAGTLKFGFLERTMAWNLSRFASIRLSLNHCIYTV